MINSKAHIRTKSLKSYYTTNKKHPQFLEINLTKFPPQHRTNLQLLQRRSNLQHETTIKDDTVRYQLCARISSKGQ
jgi:hypothetical protein